jgi:3-oxosteroid 1-dehydrogenase
VLATSTYDWDPDLVRDFLGLEPHEFGSVGPDTIRGDGIRLARSVGGATARIPPTSVPILPGWQLPSGSGYGYGPEYAMPHCIIVDRSGRRYCDDSYWVDIVAKTLAPGDRHLPFFLIWDDEHRQDYGLGGTPPGGAYPDGWVESAPTLKQLAERLGVDGEELERTVASFNLHAARGEDPDYGRGANALVVKWTGDPDHEPSPVLGALEQPPFHGMRLRFVGTAIGSSGVQIDPDGHVVNDQSGPIDGLYAVGSCAALTTTGTGYNSGFALGRGLTLAYLVAAELGGVPVPQSFTPGSRAAQ